MANEYLKPQIPLKDLNSENYFYPLTTHDQIIVTQSRLSAFMNESNNNLLDLTNIGTISSAGTVSFTGSLSVEGTATFQNQVYFKNHMHWPASINFTCDSVSANGQEWSFDLTSEDYTGTYWQVWSGKNSATILACYNDDRRVNIPVRLSIGGANNTSFSLSATSAFFSNTTRIQYNTPRFYLKDTNTAADTFAIMQFGNSSRDDAAIIFLNGPSRTADGGANMFTIRNNVGDVRIDDHLIITGWTDHQDWIQIHRTVYDQLIRFTSRGGYTSGWDSTQKIKYRSISSDNSGELYYFGPRWKDTYATAGNDSSSKTTVFQNTNYFQLRMYSFNTNGTRTNYCEGYSLPNCDQARTASAWYTIVTTKNPGALYWANVQCTTGAKTDTNPTFSSATTANYFISTGNSGWRNSTHGGGWYMSDNTWIRTYGSKSIYQNAGKIRTDGELWSQYIRIVDNWIGVYENIDNTTKRFGYMQIDRSNNGLFRFVKENGGNFYFNTLVRIDGDLHVGNNSTVGHIICGTYKDTAHGEHQIQVNSGAGRWYLYSQASATGTRGIYGHNNAGTGVSVLYMNQDNYLRAGTRLYGAVWNDYAEFRKGQMDNLKPGQVVTEIGNGEMKLANKKLQKGCKILSDTYGFALGETKECKLPIAVAGRVLVYCDTIKEELEPGDCLCANYTGNTIKMTQEEIIKYPDRIIGIVSEIPNYNIWHSLDPDNPDVLKEDIKVDGRIWVYVR